MTCIDQFSKSFSIVLHIGVRVFVEHKSCAEISIICIFFTFTPQNLSGPFLGLILHFSVANSRHQPTTANRGPLKGQALGHSKEHLGLRWKHLVPVWLCRLGGAGAGAQEQAHGRGLVPRGRESPSHANGHTASLTKSNFPKHKPHQSVKFF